MLVIIADNTVTIKILAVHILWIKKSHKKIHKLSRSVCEIKENYCKRQGTCYQCRLH